MDFYRPRPYGSGTGAVLTIDGQFFRVNGGRWTGIESSEFSLPKRYMAGEDIRPVLDERAALDFNMLRLWLLNQSVVGNIHPEGIHPAQYPDFYAKVRALADLLATYNMVGEFTAFTQPWLLMPDFDAQHAHWQSLQDAVRGQTNVTLELVNEYDHPDNRGLASDLFSMRPSGIIASSGSATADAAPPSPAWDYVCYHSNGLNEWFRKVGHNTMEYADIHKAPGSANENTRYTDDDSNPRHAYDAAAGASLLCAAACFHSNGGKFSRLFSAGEKSAAQAWVAGAKSVPLEFQAGNYHHRKDLEPVSAENPGGDPHADPSIIRAYDRQLPDGRAHVVLIHA